MGNVHHAISSGESRFIYQSADMGTAMKALMEESYEGRIFDPLADETATAALKQQRDAWEAQDRTVAFTSGVYDMVHQNHVVYMNSIRFGAIQYRFQTHEANREGTIWEELPKARQRDYIGDIVASGLVKLMVSVDGDLAVANRKGFKPTKGNMPRPLFSWDTRTRDILNLCAVANGNAHALVDAVTMHDNCHPRLAGTPNAGIMEVGAYLRPHIWGIFHESQDIIDALEADTSGQYDETIKLILHHQHLYTDKLLGGPHNTTVIIRRIGAALVEGAAADNGKVRIA